MSVPVLMYHHVMPKDGFITSSISNFEKQMRFLYANKWNTVSSREFYLYKKGEVKLPKKSVLITFDDGWRDNFIYAYPILKKYNLKATLFIVTQWVEKASKSRDSCYDDVYHDKCKELVSKNPRSVICNWNELRLMRDVFDIHSHTHTHRDQYFSGYLQWDNEFCLSKELIMKYLGINDNQLCWPRGKFNQNLIKFAKSQGYDMFYSVNRGVNIPDNNLDEIKRIAAKGDDRWLKKTLAIFTNNILGSVYGKIKK